MSDRFVFILILYDELKAIIRPQAVLIIPVIPDHGSEDLRRLICQRVQHSQFEVVFLLFSGSVFGAVVIDRHFRYGVDNLLPVFVFGMCSKRRIDTGNTCRNSRYRM